MGFINTRIGADSYITIWDLNIFNLELREKMLKYGYVYETVLKNDIQSNWELL